MEPSRDDLQALRERGLTRKQIAEQFGVTLATVRRWIRTLDVPQPAGPRRPRAPKERLNFDGGIIVPLGDGLTLIERAHDVLGARFVERRGFGYYLDGTPANVDRITAAVAAAMAVLTRGRRRPG